MVPAGQKSGCLGIFLQIFDGSPKAEINYCGGPTSLDDEVLPFRVRDDFLSPSEVSFYHVLRQAVAGRASICPKVRLIDVLFVSKLRENYSMQNRIMQKHLDFLLCAPDTMKPMAAIELDDSSHERDDRAERDDFVNRVCRDAKLPLLRIPVGRAYVLQELMAALAPLLATSSGSTARNIATSPPPLPNSEKAPECRKCGIPMVPRIARKGRNIGKQFFGCVNYPRCRETGS